MTEAERELIEAVLYAVREGCFFPVPEPEPTAGARAWVQWGALKNLHRKISAYTSAERAAVEKLRA